MWVGYKAALLRYTPVDLVLATGSALALLPGLVHADTDVVVKLRARGLVQFTFDIFLLPEFLPRILCSEMPTLPDFPTEKVRKSFLEGSGNLWRFCCTGSDHVLSKQQQQQQSKQQRSGFWELGVHPT